jgi:hypothetical protein
MCFIKSQPIFSINYAKTIRLRDAYGTYSKTGLASHLAYAFTRSAYDPKYGDGDDSGILPNN